MRALGTLMAWVREHLSISPAPPGTRGVTYLLVAHRQLLGFCPPLGSCS